MLHARRFPGAVCRQARKRRLFAGRLAEPRNRYKRHHHRGSRPRLPDSCQPIVYYGPSTIPCTVRPAETSVLVGDSAINLLNYRSTGVTQREMRYWVEHKCLPSAGLWRHRATGTGDQVGNSGALQEPRRRPASSHVQPARFESFRGSSGSRSLGSTSGGQWQSIQG
ncbi:hypothetical protein F4780DRAFT_500380 [Xylariomycetidae sp. FL0641]|nr:hypothetical protein F4780DRAFT_500380 [Xylariomycetidae sp. FL0641]